MHRPLPGTIPATAPRTIEQLARYLAAFTNYERGGDLPTDRRLLGPERCRRLIARSGGAPNCPVIQVAGSKGKGSTVLAMERLLRGRGVSTIATLSPHLERIEERLRIDGRDATSDEFVSAVATLHEGIHAIDRDHPEYRPTFFDLVIAAAASAARTHEAEALLLEVGLGGPLDSTSAVTADVAVLTLVDLEHRAQLGDTVEEIAAEKARIARDGVPFILEGSGEQSAGAIEAARAVATSLGAAVRVVEDDERVPLGIPLHRRRALILACAALEAAGFDRFEEMEIATADRQLRLPGRLEVLPGPPPLLLDGAHTIRSVALFHRRLTEFRGDQPVTLLVGAMRDKEWRLALAPLIADAAITWITTSTGGPRSADADELADEIARHERPVTPLPLGAAIERLRAADGTARAVTGSFHLAGAVRGLWREGSPTRESS